MTGGGNSNMQDWDAYPPGAYAPPAPAVPTGYAPPPAYGPPYGAVPRAGWAAMPPAWPYGPRRPGVATTAAVLGFVTGGLTAVVSLILLLAVTNGDGSPPTLLMLLGLPCAIAVVAGAAVLMGRGSPDLLFGAALASVGVLVLVAFVSMATLSVDDLIGMLVVVVLALPLPVLTAVFARQPRVRGWAAAG